jgi:hypothetical protein
MIHDGEQFITVDFFTPPNASLKLTTWYSLASAVPTQPQKFQEKH